MIGPFKSNGYVNFPEWLREITDDLTDPIPDLNRVLDESGGPASWQRSAPTEA